MPFATELRRENQAVKKIKKREGLMANCELLQACIFFNDHMANMPSTADVYKKMYCLTNFNKCARHMVVEALGRGTVPPDLFPNQEDRAKEIIANGKKVSNDN
jgi:hypothetical protein